MRGKHRISHRTPKGITFSGINYGAPLRVVAETDTQLLLHKPSLTTWDGIGQRSTYPATYLLANKLVYNYIDVIEEAEPGYQWRKCVAAMKARMT